MLADGANEPDLRPPGDEDHMARQERINASS